jgi:phospholipid/cholesterol/gamma-HCH transport system ATP-binding protein
VSDDRTIVEVRGLRKAFGHKQLFRELSLSVRRGETLTILGASGSGKSVLLKIIVGIVDADSGAVLIDGRDLVPLDEAARIPLRRRVSMLFQGGALFDSLSVAENVAYPLRHREGHDPAELVARVTDALALVDLADIGPMMPAELSGGMKKRVALARAIVTEPDILLYDEPTTGLDPINTRRIDDLIRSVQRRLGVTSIVVTHDLPSAFLVSDRLALLARGRIAAIDDVAGFRRSSQPELRAFLDAMVTP